MREKDKGLLYIPRDFFLLECKPNINIYQKYLLSKCANHLNCLAKKNDLG